MLIASDANPNTTGAKLVLQSGDPADQLNSILEGVRSGTIKAVIVASENLLDQAKRGSMVNVTGRLQKLDAACIPPGDARSDWEIIRDLILTLSGELPEEAPQSIDALSKIIAASIPEFEGKHLTAISNLGDTITETGNSIPLVKREAERKTNGEIVG